MQGIPPRSILQKQLNLQFAQYGETVYCLNALTTGALMRVVKNQLWALHLPTLTLSQVNDGPCGRVQVRLPLKKGKKAKKGDDSDKDGGKTGASSSSSARAKKRRKESSCKTCGLFHTREGSLFPSSIASFAASFFPGGRRLSRVLSFAYGLSETAANASSSSSSSSALGISSSSSTPPPMTVPASSQLMRHFRLTISPLDGELWAIVGDRFYPHQMSPTPSRRLTMYRIAVRREAFPSLASLALDMVLLRRPMAGLVSPHEARSRSAHRRRYTKQERTLEHLRAALRDNQLLVPISRYLPPPPEVAPAEKKEDRTPLLLAAGPPADADADADANANAVHAPAALANFELGPGEEGPRLDLDGIGDLLADEEFFLYFNEVEDEQPQEEEDAAGEVADEVGGEVGGEAYFQGAFPPIAVAAADFHEGAFPFNAEVHGDYDDEYDYSEEVDTLQDWCFLVA